MNRINFFALYDSAPAGHENQLTRAFLVVLRYSPIAHQAWMGLVAPGRTLHSLPKPEFSTQQQRLIRDAVPGLQAEAIAGISVWLAPDAQDPGTGVLPSDRRQILDAVVTYGSDLVVVIENKIQGVALTDQPSSINLHGAPITFEGMVRAVRWQDLLNVFADLVERDLVSGAERLVVNDFLELVATHFPLIGPFSTLARCGANRFRIARRLDAVQGLAVGRDDGKALGWRRFPGTRILMAWLGQDTETSDVCLRMYPADTLTQARALFDDAASVAAVLELRRDGWSIAPNFHWGFMAPGYAWMESGLDVDAYCSYWIREIGGTGEVPRDQWDAYWSRLEADGVVTPSSRTIFDREFTDSRRNRVHPRPGIACEFRWTVACATDLDGRNALVANVRDRINQLLSALREPLVGNSG